MNEPYEFSQEQNELLIRLSKLMKYVAIVFILLGIIIGIFCGFTIIKHPFRGISYLLQTILTITFGVWTNNIAYSFKQIVETTGKDMDILMDAFKTLKSVYTLQFIWLAIISFIILGILILNTMFGYEAFSIFSIS